MIIHITGTERKGTSKPKHTSNDTEDASTLVKKEHLETFVSKSFSKRFTMFSKLIQHINLKQHSLFALLSTRTIVAPYVQVLNCPGVIQKYNIHVRSKSDIRYQR